MIGLAEYVPLRDRELPPSKSMKVGHMDDCSRYVAIMFEWLTYYGDHLRSICESTKGIGES